MSPCLQRANMPVCYPSSSNGSPSSLHKTPGDPIEDFLGKNYCSGMVCHCLILR